MNWKQELDVGVESETVINPFSGESCVLAPEAVAIYDFLKGSEFLLAQENCTEEVHLAFQEALLYFADMWPEEYQILLD